MANIAIYGGAFDPPHLAHLFTITWLLSLPEVNQVWVMPTKHHSFGKQMSPFELRVAWLEEALLPFDPARVKISQLEAEREAPSYSYDTLEALSERYPQHTFALTVGADNLAQSARWHRFEELVARWSVFAAGREGSEAALEAAVQAGWCTPGPLMPAVSSTQLRAAARGGDAHMLRWLPGGLRASVLRHFQQAREEQEAAPTARTLVLGHGRAGAALAAALRAAGWLVTTWARDAQAGADHTGDWVPLLAQSELWILAVSDDALPEVSARLAEDWVRTAPEGASAPSALHIAGRLGAEVLRSLAEVGVRTGSLHPLQSLRGRDSAGALRGAFCAVEGEAQAKAWAHRAVVAFGGLPVEVPEGGKALWHAAAVLSANFTTVLAAGGVSLLEALGVEEAQARALLGPLLRGTVAQLARSPAGQALTGPFARGDLAAVRAHLTAMREATPEWVAAYQALARAAAQLKGWEAAQREALEAILEEPAR